MAVASIVLAFVTLVFPLAGAILGLLLGAADLIFSICAEVNTATAMGAMNDQANRMRNGSEYTLKIKLNDSETKDAKRENLDITR